MLLLITTFLVQAEPVKKPVISQDFAAETTLSTILSLNATQMDWIFSGTVTNESEDHFHYFFQLQRNNQQLHVIATLIDAQTNQVILYEESDAPYEEPENYQWHVGRAFLRFNVITNSWVFGVKNKKDLGFNFKVDMMGISNNVLSRKQVLRDGVEFLIKQTGRLNGHFQAGEENKEQFATAKKAWFQQMWVSKPQNMAHPVTVILCEFNDGAGFYAINMQELDVLKGAIAGWRDAQGMAHAMSQFVTIKSGENNEWIIHVPSPLLTLSLQDSLQEMANSQHHLIAGKIKGVMPGFCTINHYEIGQLEQPPLS